MQFSSLNKLPKLYLIQKDSVKIKISYLSLGDLHVSVDPWVDDDDEYKIIYFVFCFSCFSA
jgi:hypothetical protein